MGSPGSDFMEVVWPLFFFCLACIFRPSFRGYSPNIYGQKYGYSPQNIGPKKLTVPPWNRILKVPLSLLQNIAIRRDKSSINDPFISILHSYISLLEGTVDVSGETMWRNNNKHTCDPSNYKWTNLLLGDVLALSGCHKVVNKHMIHKDIDVVTYFLGTY